MFKVGLIGAGFMGGMHANCYKALGDKVEIGDCRCARRKCKSAG